MNPKSRRFVLKFFGVLIVGFVIIALPPVQREVITPFTTFLAFGTSKILALIGEQVMLAGTVVGSDRFAVDIRNGCNGVEAVLILVAGILAVGATWRRSILGILAGVVVLQGINLVRLVTLYLLGAHFREFFDLFHTGVWQVVIVLAALGIFVFWSVKFAGIRSVEAVD